MPSLNPFWKGIFKEFRRIFDRLGLEANLIFGYQGGIESLKNISNAELTLVLSPWVGVESARLLEEHFGIPYLVYPEIPVGPEAITQLIRELGSRLKISRKKLNRVIAEEESEAYWQLDLAGDAIAMLSPSIPFALVADSGTALGYFLLLQWRDTW